MAYSPARPLQQRIELKGAQPLVSGRYRDVYQHPLNEDLLVKVVRPSVVERRAQRATEWSHSWLKRGRDRNMAREIEEYRALHRRGLDRLPFVQRFIGVVETDSGIGMVVRKVRARDGRLAPTVSAVVQQSGLTDELRTRIAELFADVIRYHVVFGDIRSINILQASDEEHGDRLVIVDGLGDYLWLPINTWSPLAYRMYCKRRLARAMEKLEIIDRAWSAQHEGLRAGGTADNG